MHVNVDIIPGLISAIFTIFLSIKVYKENPKNIQNRVFVLLMFFFSILGFSNFLVNHFEDIYIILFFSQFYYLAAIVSPVIFLHFTIVFPTITNIKFKVKLFLFMQYLLTILFFSFLIINTSINDVKLTDFGNYVHFNEQTRVIGWYISLILILSACNLFKKYRRIVSSIEKQQLRNVFIGGLIAIIFVIGHLILLYFNILTYFVIPLALIIFSFFIAAAILRLKLLSYKPMARSILGRNQISLLNRNQLEKEVEARTAALQKINRKLLEEINQRKKVEIEITDSLREKEILLKEVHHRVKNNLQIISSLIYLQSRKIKQKEITSMLNEINNRIRSMSLIHETIYQSNNLNKINFEDYIKTLVAELLSIYAINKEKIKMKIDLKDIYLDIDISILLGLIVNELVVNAIKHAFPTDNSGEIAIETEASKGTLILKVSDNGVGLPGDIDLENIHSLGLQLVHNLVKQLNGVLTIHTNGKSEFHISIPSK
jgi:two-component sensor histidine kinase